MRSESGNVLWFIMIAVALLGLLTMVLSRGGSSSDQTGDFEQLRVQASEILRYARSIEAAVQEMELRGVSENDISFENTISTTDYTNTNCDDASDRSYPSCQIFNVGGAGLTYMAPNSSWLESSESARTFYGDWLFASQSCIPEVGEGSSSACRNFAETMELIILLPYININLCKHINNYLNPDFISNPPQDNGRAWGGDPVFSGSFTAGRAILDSDTNSELIGVFTGCFEGGHTTNLPTGTYHFFHVLKAR